MCTSDWLKPNIGLNAGRPQLTAYELAHALLLSVNHQKARNTLSLLLRLLLLRATTSGCAE
jgi:hypothetical protein